MRVRVWGGVWGCVRARVRACVHARAHVHACVCVCVRMRVRVCVYLGSREASRWGSCSLNGVGGKAEGSGEQSRTLWCKVCVLGGIFPAWPATAARSGEEGSSAQGGRRRGR